MSEGICPSYSALVLELSFQTQSRPPPTLCLDIWMQEVAALCCCAQRLLLTVSVSHSPTRAQILVRDHGALLAGCCWEQIVGSELQWQQKASGSEWAGQQCVVKIDSGRGQWLFI